VIFLNKKKIWNATILFFWFVHIYVIVAVVVGKSHDVFMDKSKSKSNPEMACWLSTGMAQLLTHVSLLYG
jgi:hypothetical protein